MILSKENNIKGKISAETFGEILNTVIAIYEGRKNSKEKKIRTENHSTKKSDLLYFLAQEPLKKRKTVLKGILKSILLY